MPSVLPVLAVTAVLGAQMTTVEPIVGVPAQSSPIFARTVFDPTRQAVLAYDWLRHEYFTAPSGTATWTRLAPIPGEPPRRLGAVMVADPLRNRIVLFGGDTGTARLDDTWEYDGTRWQQRNPRNRPQGMAFGCGCHDANAGRVVLVAGRRDALGVPLPTTETWSWDGSEWQLRTTTALPMFGATIAADLARAVLVAFAGTATHELRNSTWQAMTPLASPSPRSAHGMAYDPRRQRIVVFAGIDVASTAQLNDFWEYDGTSWVRRQPQATPLRVRSGSDLHWDPVARAIVVVGGQRLAGDTLRNLHDVVLYMPTVPAEAEPAGAGCPQRPDAPALEVPGLPWLGRSLQLLTTPAAPGLCVFVAGLSATVDRGAALPRPLDPFGIAGCRQLVSADASALVLPDPLGRCVLTLPIPAAPVLLGVQMFAQAIVSATGGLAVTDARRLVVGGA